MSDNTSCLQYVHKVLKQTGAPAEVFLPDMDLALRT